MKSQKAVRRIAASIATVAITAVATGVPALRAADNKKSETLIYAVYDGQDTASQVYKTMHSNQSSTGERIEAYAVVSKDLKGKVRVRDQRRRDSGVGAVVGGVIGLVGGPVGVAAGAAAGGAVGYLTGDAVGISRDNVESMKQALVEDSSALVVVLEDRWVKDVQRDMQQAQSREVIASQIANK
ncbi:MAG TPA: DUF1269 domain-containing protein [Vicinamibacterales bacterium]|nr:DUF1269 domain-containing protein [Vicinamibacterales bacterium]